MNSSAILQKDMAPYLYIALLVVVVVALNMNHNSKPKQGLASQAQGMTLTLSRKFGSSSAEEVSLSNMQFVLDDGTAVPVSTVLTLQPTQTSTQTSVPFQNAGSVLAMRYKLNSSIPCTLDVVTPQARTHINLIPQQSQTTAGDIALVT
jgi:hypothetical protein